MPNDYMDSSQPSQAPTAEPPAPETDTAVPEEKPDEGEGETGLLPKDFFMGKDKKPGDRCEVEVVHVYDDQIEVKYLDSEDKSESDAGTDEGMAAGGKVTPPAGMMGME